MAEMTIERARQIVRECMNNVWWEGMRTAPPVSLEPYSLAEMLEANHLVAADPFEPQPQGNAFRQPYASDELVAALYVATHCGPREAPLLTVGDAAVMVVRREAVSRG